MVENMIARFFSILFFSTKRNMYQVVILLSVFVISLALERPNLSNLRQVSLDYDVYSFSEQTENNNLHYEHLQGIYNSTGRKYSAYFATFSPNYFSFYPPTSSGCTKLLQPSVSSKNFGCEYATNGAFFTWSVDSSGSLCIGNLISDGKIWQLPTDGSGTGRANFGITSQNEYIIGFIDADVISSRNFTQLITGWGWLVRNGMNYVNSSDDLSYSPGGFTLEKAPRTTVGFYRNGSMVLLEIDGEEDINEGPDLFEAAELLVSLGVESAINIDGGGSSVSVYDGNVIDEPTCNDTPEICERPDATITCVKKSLG